MPTSYVVDMIATDLPLREDPPVFAAAEGDGLLPLRLAWAVLPALPPSGACQPVPPPLPALCAEPAEPDDELRGTADCFLLLRRCLAGEGEAGSSTSSSSNRESWLISRYCWPLLRANGVDMVGLRRLAVVCCVTAFARFVSPIIAFHAAALLNRSPDTGSLGRARTRSAI
jgi:hypothetical protein